MLNPKIFFLVFFFVLGFRCMGNEIPLRAIFELDSFDDQTFKPEDIIKTCSKLISKKEKNELILLNAFRSRGLAYSRLKKYENAKKDFEKFCLLKPKDANGCFLMAGVYHGMKFLNKAIEESKKAIKLDPKFSNAHLALGIFFYETGKRKEGLDSINKAISIDPKNANAYFFRGDYFGPE